MKPLLSIILLLWSVCSAAQKDTIPPRPIDIRELPSNDGSFTRVESPPRFPGGDAALVDHVARALHYPDPMRQARVEGVVHVAFTITDAGEVRNVRVEQGIPGGETLNAEAVRMVSAMPRWEPARVKGVTVPMDYVLPVKFELGQ